MQQHRLSLTQFRNQIGSLCRDVKRGKKELIVSRYYDDLFKVVKADTELYSHHGLTYVRDNASMFLEALETHKSLVLSERGKPLVKVILINE